MIIGWKELAPSKPIADSILYLLFVKNQLSGYAITIYLSLQKGKKIECFSACGRAAPNCDTISQLVVGRWLKVQTIFVNDIETGFVCWLSSAASSMSSSLSPGSYTYYPSLGWQEAYSSTKNISYRHDPGWESFGSMKWPQLRTKIVQFMPNLRNGEFGVEMADERRHAVKGMTSEDKEYQSKQMIIDR